MDPPRAAVPSSNLLSTLPVDLERNADCQPGELPGGMRRCRGLRCDRLQDQLELRPANVRECLHLYLPHLIAVAQIDFVWTLANLTEMVGYYAKEGYASPRPNLRRRVSDALLAYASPRSARLTRALAPHPHDPATR